MTNMLTEVFHLYLTPLVGGYALIQIEKALPVAELTAFTRYFQRKHGVVPQSSFARQTNDKWLEEKIAELKMSTKVQTPVDLVGLITADFNTESSGQVFVYEDQFRYRILLLTYNSRP